MTDSRSQRPSFLDATRVSDGQTVWLKHVTKTTPEIEIGRYLASNDLSTDPTNHCVPLLDVLQDPRDTEHVILVFPLLRRIDSPLFGSIRECVDFVNQTLEVCIRAGSAESPADRGT